MALIRGVGGLVTITPGATHYWQYWFGNFDEVGVAMATPNELEESTSVELIASDFGVTQKARGGEAGNGTIYTVRIHNPSPFSLSYNLNIGFLS